MMLPGSIRIFRVQGTVDVIRHQLDRLLDEGFDLGLVIIDYGDIVSAQRSRERRYAELGDIFRSLRELAHEYNCPVWTATQATRGSLGKEIITMADLAESFMKAHIADAIVAICQTREEEQNEAGRLFLAKLRDGRARRMVRIKFFTEEQAIITTGFVGEYEGLYGGN
jgi:replicative DNA helicase